MKINNKIKLVVAVLGLITVSAFAQNKINGMQMKMPAMPTFEKVDVNNDGKATEEEFNQCRADRMKEMVESGKMAEMQRKGMKMNPPSFADIAGDKDYFTKDDFSTFKAKMKKEKMNHSMR